jgi:hypothetical protein
MADAVLLWLGYALAAFAALVFVAHLPVLPTLRVMRLHAVPDRKRLVACMWEAWAKNLLAIVPDLLAPVAVPVALLFTRWGDEHLPRWAWWWDNDASINGDVRTDDPTDGLGGWALKPVPLARGSLQARAMCYWAPGHHPRSFYARWVWLGLRNRASALSQALGSTATGPATFWNGPTWTITRVADDWRFYELLPIPGTRLSIRMHCGYKVPRLPGEAKAAAVSIGLSLRRERRRLPE